MKVNKVTKCTCFLILLLFIHPFIFETGYYCVWACLKLNNLFAQLSEIRDYRHMSPFLALQ